MKKNKKKIKLTNLSKLEMKKVVGGNNITTEATLGTTMGVYLGCPPDADKRCYE